MFYKKNDKQEKIVSQRDLLIDETLIDKSRVYYKEFNEFYSKFCDLNDMGILTSDWAENGKEAAIIVAKDFDFSDLFIDSKKNDYIKVARDILYAVSSKPHNDSEALIYVIRALYGQTNIGYNLEGENKGIHIDGGNEWVTYLERNTNDRTLKSYALTLRAFQYIVNGDILNMTVKERIKKVETELLYAIKWQDDNYLAYFALGLLYCDDGHSKYNPQKALENFNKVLTFKKIDVKLDKYLLFNEKEKAMANAQRKIDELSSL